MMSDSRAPRQLGRANPLVGRIRSLSRSAEERASAGLMIVEGVRLAAEALDEGVVIQDAVVSERLGRLAGGTEIETRLTKACARVWSAGEGLLDSLHDAGSAQGILLVVERPARTPEQVASAHGPRTLLLMAWGVQDPGNMGALVRLADAAGGTGLLAVGGADPFGPKAVRASAGSVFRLPVARVPGTVEALELLGALRGRRVTIAGAMPRGGASHREADLSGPMALVVGGEGAGLPMEVAAALDVRLTIPMSPRVDSLNVAAAAAVLMFEAAAARQPTSPRAPDPDGRPGSRPASRKRRR